MPGRTDVHELDSALLAGNHLGTPTLRRMPVYLPPGYDDAGAPEGYPLLVALAGFTGTGLSYLNVDWYQEALPERLDRLIESGAMPPAIVVMVDGMTWIGGNQYVDSSAVGPWAQHITKEVVPWAESSFRVLPGRAHRGVFGKSSGGYGALMMGLEHADVFAGVVSHSGDCYFEYCHGSEIPGAVSGLRSVGGLGPFLERLRTKAWPRFPGKLFGTLDIVAMSHFYSPDPDAPFGIQLPFDEETGERREEVFARWLTRDPAHLVGDNVENLKSLRHLYIECGTRDEWHLHHGARILSARLEDHGVPHEHVEFDDGHRSLNYRYDEALPGLVKALLPE